MTDATPADRNAARALWTASGLDYAVLTTPNLRRLISLIDAEMKASGLIRGSFRMCAKFDLRHRSEVPMQAELRCSAVYFKRREAVTFGSDGFVGFAGWADDENVKPVLAGFARWVS